MSRNLILVGAGGAGAETAWLVDRINSSASDSWNLLGFADDTAVLAGTKVEGIPVLGSIDEVVERFRGQSLYFHVCIGSNTVRRKVADRLLGAGFVAASLIDPQATVAPSAIIGEGSYVGATAIVSVRARVGRFALINFGAMIGHDCDVGEFVQLCPGARMNGGCSAADEVFLGANAVMAPRTKLGRGAVLGAASFLTSEGSSESTLLGVPARPLFTKKTT